MTDPAFAEDRKRLEEVYTKEWANEIREKITDVSRSFDRPPVPMELFTN